jgi:hypothetical protein
MGVGSLFVPAILHFEEGPPDNLPAATEKAASTAIDQVGEAVLLSARSNPAEVDCT